MGDVDLLAAVTGSGVRADVLAILHADPTKVWTSSEVGRAARRRSHVVERELRRLAERGLVRVTAADNKRLYSADLRDPVARGLARFVRQTRGSIPRIRGALEKLRSPVLAWTISSQTQGARNPARGIRSDVFDLIVLTAVPRSLVRIQLTGLVGREVTVHCMSLREWLARLEKGDVFIRRARRARKQWVVGSWEELAQRERAQLDSARALKAAVANWREELSDEWDEDWDPMPGSGRGPE
jgi:hypothetical protein